MNNDQVILNETVMNFNAPNKNKRIYLPMKHFGFKTEVDNAKINEWFVQCLEAELSKRQSEFNYLNSLVTSQIPNVREHANTIVTLEEYIYRLKKMIETYGGRFNGNI